MAGSTPAPFDEGLTLADRMRAHARDSTHLYGHLMRAMADDWESGGVVRTICAGWEDCPRGTVVQLRLLGGLFRVVLTGRADELVPYYPCLGGDAAPGHAWPTARDVMSRHVDELHEALLLAPQTNEVGRSQALLVGIFEAVRRTGLCRVRLLEPGASAGLNLLVDRFRFENPGWTFGPAGSPLVLREGIEGAAVPVPFEVVERRGCDLAPIDAATPDGALRLRSFVWPFHLERHERLAAALEIAAERPVRVDRASASDWLAEQLATDSGADVLTVVWHSITRLYWPAEETDRVERVIAEAAERQAVARVAMEYAVLGEPGHPDVTVDWSPPAGGLLRHERLGTAGDHGFPVRVDGRGQAATHPPAAAPRRSPT